MENLSLGGMPGTLVRRGVRRGARGCLLGALLLVLGPPDCGALAAGWKEQIEAEWLARPLGSPPKRSGRPSRGRISREQDAAGAVAGAE